MLYPPVLKSGDQVPRWAETELQAMGPLCSREKRMLGADGRRAGAVDFRR
ncbi:anion permease [Escherichia coli]|nr:anion permease [Escherichia coli]